MPTIRSGQVKNAGAIADALSSERKAVPVGVKAAAEPIQLFLETLVSIPYPPASSPGQPAHQRTEKYKRAWQARPSNLTLTIKNGVRYAGFLEFGTRYMKARPALTTGTGAGGGGGAAARSLVRRAGRSAADTARRAPVVRSNV